MRQLTGGPAKRRAFSFHRCVRLNPPVVLVLDRVNTRCSGVLLVSLEPSFLHKRTTRDSNGHACSNALGPTASARKMMNSVKKELSEPAYNEARIGKSDRFSGPERGLHSCHRILGEGPPSKNRCTAFPLPETHSRLQSKLWLRRFFRVHVTRVNPPRRILSPVFLGPWTVVLGVERRMRDMQVRHGPSGIRTYLNSEYLFRPESSRARDSG